MCIRRHLLNSALVGVAAIVAPAVRILDMVYATRITLEVNSCTDALLVVFTWKHPGLSLTNENFLEHMFGTGSGKAVWWETAAVAGARC